MPVIVGRQNAIQRQKKIVNERAVMQYDRAEQVETQHEETKGSVEEQDKIESQAMQDIVK